MSSGLRSSGRRVANRPPIRLETIRKDRVDSNRTGNHSRTDSMMAGCYGWRKLTQGATKSRPHPKMRPFPADSCLDEVVQVGRFGEWDSTTPQLRYSPWPSTTIQRTWTASWHLRALAMRSCGLLRDLPLLGRRFRLVMPHHL